MRTGADPKPPRLVRRVVRHLLHPCLVGMPCDASQADTVTFQVNEEQQCITSTPQVRASTVKKSMLANTDICV